jgi:peptidoglycan hydrolase-like protein with peptidoglycan-binding domain
VQGDSVIELQQRLNQLGYRVQVDGQYGSETEQAVRALQSSRNLYVDGVVGEDTRTALGLPRGGVDNTFTSGVNSSSATLGSKRYVVMIPTTDATTLSKVKWYFRSASEVRTPLGSYIQVRGYASRSEAERLSNYLRKEGFRDAHVRYF